MEMLMQSSSPCIQAGTHCSKAAGPPASQLRKLSCISDQDETEAHLVRGVQAETSS